MIGREFKMKRFLTHVICLSLALVILLSPAQAATPEQVDAAVKKAVEYIYKIQNSDGHWESGPSPGFPLKTDTANQAQSGQWGGTSALMVYALLAAGENPQDPRLAKAIEFLKKNEMIGIYTLGLRTQVWLNLPRSNETRELMRRDLDVLLKGVQEQKNARGMYFYIETKSETLYNHSSSQYGVLGVWAAERLGGLEIPLGYWQIVEEAWVRNQNANGGWAYRHPADAEGAPYIGMTAAGVATLFVTQDYLHSNEGISCKGNVTNPAIEKGLKWVADNSHMIAPTNPPTEWPQNMVIMAMYAVERIGVASGIKYFGNVDWYKAGADWIVKHQGDSGGMGGPIDTAFGCLFLTYGRAPIVMNKLDYSGGSDEKNPAPWNQRPRDVANVTRWLGLQLERHLNWQVMPISAPVRDFHDAPILYMSGNQKIVLTDEQKKKLRDFCEQGGLILGHADCGSTIFAQSFRALGQELFPKYEFRQLHKDHLIYNNNFRADKWKTKPAVMGLSNDVRELMLLIPTGDPAKFWQLRTPGGREEVFQLLANIFLYVNDRQELRYKGTSHIVAANLDVATTRALKLGRVEYSTNWDPEPAGWQRLAAVMRNNDKLDLQVSPIKLDAKLGEMRVLHITGTGAWKLDEGERAALHEYVKGGGTIIIDAAGGSSIFATAAEAEIAALFPEAKLEALPLDHAVYNAGGNKIENVEYRHFAQAAMQGRVKTPRLQGIQRDGRVVLFYSREDLSAGLVGESMDGILGYSPESATAIMRNILLHVADTKQK
jgi:hypothetical protein